MKAKELLIKLITDPQNICMDNIGYITLTEQYRQEITDYLTDENLTIYRPCHTPIIGNFMIIWGDEILDGADFFIRTESDCQITFYSID